jgi:hypothetical protein
MRFPKRSSLLKKDPHAQTSLNRMFHGAKVLRAEKHSIEKSGFFLHDGTMVSQGERE